jgi:hypothetical protein
MSARVCDGALTGVRFTATLDQNTPSGEFTRVAEFDP